MSEYNHFFNKYDPSLADEIATENLIADNDSIDDEDFDIPKTKYQTDYYLNHFRSQEEIDIEIELRSVSHELIETASKIRLIYNEYNGNKATLTPDNPLRNNFIQLTINYKKLLAKYEALSSRLLELNPQADISKYPKQ